MSWSAKQYLAFEDERTRPVRDLLAAVPGLDATCVIDIGCGPGNSTELLAARFPNARVSGIDSSADMISAARRRLPRVAFDVIDIGTWLHREHPSGAGAAMPFDVILANAVLQWVPDHAEVFPALANELRVGGCLAVQMPDNLAEPAQLLMRELAARGAWSAKLAAADQARVPIAPADGYYGLMRQTCARVDVWRTTYYHPLAGAAAVVEWFKGTGLRPFLDPLDAAERGEYLARYTEAIGKAYPALADGSVLLPFPRLFIVAVR
ncbi:MAG TPA: trans-aconitate 2-methyltransferase [Steroidobacteraceae bacterium]|nr:trans-aconitate 2-methyltransferase [Steroidobacteraceae bacterium]